MINTIAERSVVQGDQITGMSVVFTDSHTWSGEFHAVYGDGSVSRFLAECTGSVSNIYLSVRPNELFNETLPTTTHATYMSAIRHG
jgi:hypothetical protein